MELLVPVGIFAVGIIIATMGGSVGIARLVEGQKAVSENLGHTAAYEAPFIKEEGKR